MEFDLKFSEREDLKVLVTCHHESSQDTGVSGIMLDVISELETRPNIEVSFLSHDKIRFIPIKLRYIFFPILILLKLLFNSFFARPYTHVWSTSGDLAFSGLFKILMKSPIFVFHSHNIEPLADDQAVRNGTIFRFRYKMFRKLVVYPLVRKSAKASDYALVYSKNEVDYVSNLTKNAKVLLINNYCRHHPPNSHRAKETKTLTYIGQGTFTKGFDLVLESSRQLLDSQSFDSLQLLGIGKTDYEEALSTLVTNYAEKVTLVRSYRNVDLPNYLKFGGVIILPSRSEGYPVSIMEGMAWGLVPVLSMLPIHERIAGEAPNIFLATLDADSLVATAIMASGVSSKQRELNRNWSRNFSASVCVGEWVEFIFSGYPSKGLTDD